MALDGELLSTSPERLSRVDGLTGWTWDEEDYPTYKRVPSRNGYYVPGTNHSEDWPVVRELHLSFIARAAKKFRTLNIRSQPKHSTAVLEVLRRELGQSVPSPIHPDHSADQPWIPEEITPNAPLVEGACKVIKVNAYERSPTARRKCLDHHGTRCTVCGCDLSEIYGQVAAGLIHVHHLNPLGDVGEGCEVDPIKDLRPVCPNCHSVIHRRSPPYTLEDVKQFLETTTLLHR